MKPISSIEAFWRDRETPEAFLKLLDALDETVIVNIERYPMLGRPFLTRAGQSEEVETRMARLQRHLGDMDVRDICGDYLILYGVQNDHVHPHPSITIFFLAIRHYLQLSLDFMGLWGDVGDDG